jgi:hypothetical protein
VELCAGGEDLVAVGGGDRKVALVEEAGGGAAEAAAFGGVGVVGRLDLCEGGGELVGGDGFVGEVDPDSRGRGRNYGRFGDAGVLLVLGLRITDHDCHAERGAGETYCLVH